MDSHLRQLYDRAHLRLTSASGRAKIPGWMEQHLRHPKDVRKPWSFKGHEYQIQIAADTAPFVDVKKSSQVGVSQLSVSIALALSSLYQGDNVIYVLPSTRFAQKFTTSRIDPVIAGSPLLRDMLNRSADSTEMKQIGISFLFITGAQKAGQAISVPARVLIIDEKDFASQSVLTTFNSRLSHTAPEDRVRMSFSTPTVPEYGIDRSFGEGTGFVYMVMHEACNQWTIVDPVYDIVIPGFDETLLTFTRAEMSDPRVRTDKAWVRCQCCGGEISRGNLTDAGKRQWVAKRPGLERHSYYVSPLDVAVLNKAGQAIVSAADIVGNVANYDRHDDFINFGLGVAYQSAENTVTREAVENSLQIQMVRPSKNCMYGTGVGMDVGKVSHLTVIKPDRGKYRVVWAQKIRQRIRGDGTDETSEIAIERINDYGAARMVVDAMPDITVPAKIIERSMYHQTWAAYFVRSIKGMDNFSLNEAEQFVNVARTEMIDGFVKDFNSGNILLPADSPELEEIKIHLSRLKRIKRVSEATGEVSAAWISTSDDDHWFFSLLYAYVACKMFNSGAAIVLPMAGRLISRVKTKVA